MAKDNVNHPAHYTDGKIEVIEYIEDKKFGYCLGNVVKYISRAGKKNKRTEVEDLKKAAWYLNREIQRLEALQGKTVTAPPEDPFPQCYYSGCEAAGKACAICPNNIYRTFTAKEIFDVLFTEANLAGEGDSQSYIIDTLTAKVIRERYGIKAEVEEEAK